MTDTSAPQAPLTAYTCTDIDDGYSATVRAESAAKAAQAYVDGGGWHVDDRTIWIRVRVDGHGVHRIAIEPEAPTCANNSDGHDWRDLHTTGSGGGVLITERCLQVQDIERTRDATTALDDAVEAMAAWVRTGA